MAINNDRTVSVTLHTVLSTKSRIVVPRPDCISCIPYAILTKNTPIVIRLGRRGSFELATRRLRTIVAPGAGVLVVPFPGGPANTVVRGTSLRTVIRIIGRRSLFIVDSRVCSRLACISGRMSVTSFPKVGRHAILVGNFSGTCTVAN